MGKKKILYIDNWEKGYRNFLRLNQSFVDLNFETLLVHTGSFIDDFEGEKEKHIENLHIRDISFYKTIYLKKVIEIEVPDVIIILNLSFVLDRAIINLCKNNNIKIVYLSHGHLTKPGEAQAYIADINKTIFKKIGRIFRKKNLLNLLNYISSFKNTEKAGKIFQLIIKIFKSPATFLAYGEYCSELDTDLILVYSERDKQHFVEDLKFPLEKIIVVGNPEISEFLNRVTMPKHDFLIKYGIDPDTRYYVYLDDGLTNDKTYDWNNEIWYEHLNKINAVLNKQGFSLIVKLHPRVALEDHIGFFNTSKGIYAFQDIDFKNLLFYSEGAISHYSGTINYALLFHKRVLVPRWGHSHNLLRNYPENIVFYCNSIEIFESNLQKEVNVVAINDYLQINGISGGENSIYLITNKVKDLII